MSWVHEFMERLLQAHSDQVANAWTLDEEKTSPFYDKHLNWGSIFLILPTFIQAAKAKMLLGDSESKHPPRNSRHSHQNSRYHA